MTSSGSDDSTHIWQIPPKAAWKKAAEPVAQFIVVVEGSEAGRKVELTLAPIEVGRREDNQFVLPDPCISRHHCTISYVDGQVRVTDAGSPNGTFMDDERITGTVNWPMDSSLRVGNQILRREYRHREDVRRTDALTEDLRRAARYVQSLLPLPLARGPVKAAWRFLPSAELGGDIFDYFWLDAENFAFYLLDVCGHGTGAALHSVSVFNLLRQRSLANADLFRPGQVLRALNQALPMDRYGDMYFTMWYGVYRPGDHHLNFASAGHPPGLLFVDGSHGLRRLETPNPPLGVIADMEFAEAAMTLPAGSHVYLYSDGVFEMTTPSGEMWTSEEFAAMVEEQSHMGFGQPELVFQQVRKLAATDQVEDDFSLLRFSF